MHTLDLAFHLSRQTGNISRVLDRGTRGISFLVASMVFNIAPTALEISMVTAILATKFGWQSQATAQGPAQGPAQAPQPEADQSKTQPNNLIAH